MGDMRRTFGNRIKHDGAVRNRFVTWYINRATELWN
jgi:hypothetical protein